MRQRQRLSQGFTLLELLIALAVFSILSVMAYSGLNSSLNNAAHVRAQAEKLSGLQTAFSFIQRDIEQTAARSIRDQFGTSLPAMSGGTLDNTVLEFTRLGWRNPTGSPRSQLQRVAYRLEEEQLTRLTWATLDRADDTAPAERDVLENVKGLSLRFLDNSLEWQDQWPPSSFTAPNLAALPRAIELTMDTAGYGEIRRVFRVPPGESVVKARTVQKGGPALSNTSQGSNNNNSGNSGGSTNNNVGGSDEP